MNMVKGDPNSNCVYCHQDIKNKNRRVMCVNESRSWQHNIWSPNPYNFLYTARTVTAAAVITTVSPIFKSVSVIINIQLRIMTLEHVAYECRLEYLI